MSSSMKNPIRNIETESIKPHMLFLRILGIIFVAEFIVMIFLWYFDVTTGIFEFFLDSFSLSFISAPFLYLLVVRVVAKRLKEAALRAQIALENELTSKALAEQMLLKAYADNIVKSVPSGLVVVSRDLRVYSVNPSFCQMFSTKEEYLAGKSIDEVLPFPGLKETVLEVVSTGTPRQNIVFDLSDEERDKYVQVNITGILPAEGERERQILIVVEDITERKVSEAKILYMAYHDNLTGLPNRRLLIDRLTQVMAHVRRQKLLAAILFLDVDRFKLINDTLGHNIGDELLKIIAGKLKQCSRTSDTVARLGGDEFIILLTDVDRIEDLVHIVKRFFEVFNIPVNLRGHKFLLTASIGVSVYPNDGEDAETLLKNADAAMYRAKSEGRNNWQFYSSSMNASGLEWITMENKLRKAIEEGEFILNYQPQVDLHTNEVIGVEALIRWQDPDQGIIPPNVFIPIAEDSGLIIPIGEWVLRTACAQNRKWQGEGLKHVRVSVNTSIRQFKQKDFVSIVSKILNETGLDPGDLEIEVTESIIMSNAEDTIKILRELKDLGIRLAIDDFGTGYSSLAYLKHMPVDLLKIDQSFVRNITFDENDAAICTTIINMAKSLKIEVIAEGVETMEQFLLLTKLGCDKIQGYIVSKPLLPEKVDTFLHNDWSFSCRLPSPAVNR